MRSAVLFDVDGTLVDSNYHHVLAWARAFADVGVHPPLWRVHRHLGMGGDQLVAAVAGDEVEAEHGDALRDGWVRHFDPLIAEVRPFEGATDLLRHLRSRGHQVVLASSGKPPHVEHFVDLLGARDVVEGWTTSEDVERTKPAPDLLEVARGLTDADRVVSVGDAVWDFHAAGRLGIAGVGVLTGGTSEAELRESGAAYVVPDLRALRTTLDVLLDA